MGRHKSAVLTSIESLYAAQNLSIPDLSKKAKLLLDAYRPIYWATLGSHTDKAESSADITDESILKAISCLNSYSPSLSKSEFALELKNETDSNWLFEIINQTMTQVKEFPQYGDLYFDILSTVYLNRFKYSEADLLDLFKMERSCYYDRKKEAILLFAWSLWGSVLPRAQSMVKAMPLIPEPISVQCIPVIGTVCT